MGKETKYICIAGKNSVSVNAIEFIYNNFKDEYKIYGLPNSNDDGIDSWQPSFKKKLLDLNIEIIKIEDLYDIENLIFISLEYNRIIKPEKFKTDKLYNIHFSYLPSYKGMYTSAMPILNNEKYSGVTLHYIDKGIDTGKIIEQIKFTINKNDDSFTLYQKYNYFSFELFKSSISNLLSGNYITKKQPYKSSSYYSKKSIDYSNLKIDFNQTAESIYNQIRAFAFRPYQLPKFNNNSIRFSKITNNLSEKKVKQIIHEDYFSFTISTIDYNIILYKDCLETMLDAIRNKENSLVKRYINIDYPLEDKNQYGWDMLIVATYSGNKEVFDLLIKKGVNIKTTNYKKTNLLMYALTPLEEHNDRYFFDNLIKLGLDVKLKDSLGFSTLDWVNKRKINI